MARPNNGTDNEYPVVTVHDDADKAANALLSLPPSLSSRFVIVEYPRAWGNHIGCSKTRRGCIFQFRNS